jgi:hypothetical protein
MDRIKIKPTNNFTGANAFPSGGSVASELVCYVSWASLFIAKLWVSIVFRIYLFFQAALRACETLKERLKPILEKLENPSWEKLIAEAHNAKIDLTASHM